MDVHVILAQRPWEFSLYLSSFSISADERSTVFLFLKVKNKTKNSIA